MVIRFEDHAYEFVENNFNDFAYVLTSIQPRRSPIPVPATKPLPEADLLGLRGSKESQEVGHLRNRSIFKAERSYLSAFSVLIEVMI